MQLCSRSVGNWSRSHDLLGDFLMITRSSLVVAGVKHFIAFSESGVQENHSHYH